MTILWCGDRHVVVPAAPTPLLPVLSPDHVAPGTVPGAPEGRGAAARLGLPGPEGLGGYATRCFSCSLFRFIFL